MPRDELRNATRSCTALRKIIECLCLTIEHDIFRVNVGGEIKRGKGAQIYLTVAWAKIMHVPTIQTSTSYR